jgi:outer membrane protein OmpA-like peptidoglycan-associated protein
MRYSVNAAAGLALLASTVPAAAQWGPPASANWAGPYGGLSLGGEWARLGSSVAVAPTPAGAVPGSPAVAGSTISRGIHNDTITGGGQAGYNWQLNNWVFGVEGDFRGGGPSGTSTITAVAPGTANFAVGDGFHASSDWNASARGRIGYAFDRALLYATGGIAFADANMSANFVPVTAGGTPFPGSRASDSTVLIGPTVGGGLEYALTPNVSVGAEYRYTDYGHSRLNLGRLATAAGPGAGAGGPFATAPVSGNVGLREQAILAKINYRFGAPPPPPPVPAAMPAAPPPPPPKVFIVFFDWDKSTITPEGMAVIQQAAAASSSGAPVRVQVTGYTDRSGSPSYNQRLSERRANAVANAMSQLGVPRNQMAVSGRGENDNRVPTADGVREPQNRRVEISAP